MLPIFLAVKEKVKQSQGYSSQILAGIKQKYDRVCLIEPMDEDDL